jgi:hypothetical protein
MVQSRPDIGRMHRRRDVASRTDHSIVANRGIARAVLPKALLSERSGGRYLRITKSAIFCYPRLSRKPHGNLNEQAQHPGPQNLASQSEHRTGRRVVHFTIWRHVYFSVRRSVHIAVRGTLHVSIWRHVHFAIRWALNIAVWGTLDFTIWRSIDISVWRTIDLRVWRPLIVFRRRHVYFVIQHLSQQHSPLAPFFEGARSARISASRRLN